MRKGLQVGVTARLMICRAHIEKEMVKLYSKEQCEHLCNTVLNIPYETVRQIVESSIKDNTGNSGELIK